MLENLWGDKGDVGFLVGDYEECGAGVGVWANLSEMFESVEVL